MSTAQPTPGEPETHEPNPVAPTQGVAGSSVPGPSPGRIEELHGWGVEHWPTSHRRGLAIIAVVVALSLIAIPWIVALANEAVADLARLDVLAYAGMMIVCWVGAGGALVPIPGARPLSWLLIVQQGAVLDPLLVALAAALAMAVGETSYFVATRAGGQHLHHHDRRAAADRSQAPDPAGRDDGAEASRWRRLMADGRRLLTRAQDAVASLMSRHPRRTIFLVSLVPSPLTTFGAVAAAKDRVMFRDFFVASLAGFLVLALALVIAGQAILTALGVSAD
jgi:uncharacterized membrane protein YdjX (TVP38/TMEM64 family)